MDNKEIALHLTVAAMNNRIIKTDELPDDLVSEPIKDFFFDILESLNIQLDEDK